MFEARAATYRLAPGGKGFFLVTEIAFLMALFWQSVTDPIPSEPFGSRDASR